MTHGQFTVRVSVVCLATAFAILALAAGIPAQLVFAGAAGWTAASFGGVGIANAMCAFHQVYDPERERDLMRYLDDLEEQWQRQLDEQDRFEDYGENTMPEGKAA